MSRPVSTYFLRDVNHGGPPDQLQRVADALAAFLGSATASIDVAIYDFRLDDPDATQTVVGALLAAAGRGVSVRIGYDAGRSQAATAADFAVLQADPAPPGTPQWVEEHFGSTAVQTRGIQAGDQLMHSKYVLRDAQQAGAAAVWTGSTNFTDDAWTLQENNIVTIVDDALATAYRSDFDEMWDASSIRGAGTGLGGQTELDVSGAGTGAGTGTGPAVCTLGWDFCPGDGEQVTAALVKMVTGAQERIVIAAMVLTSHPLLAALVAALDRGVPITGIYDGGQMDPIVAQWRTAGYDAQVLADWERVSAVLARKQSVPYSPTSEHNFMHLKILLVDAVVATGSFNFSANAQRNAENHLQLNDPVTVQAYFDYLAMVGAAYPQADRQPVASR